MVWKTNQCVFSPYPNDLWKQSNKKAACVYFGQSNRLIRASGWLVHHTQLMSPREVKACAFTETFLWMECLLDNFSFLSYSTGLVTVPVAVGGSWSQWWTRWWTHVASLVLWEVADQRSFHFSTPLVSGPRSDSETLAPHHKSLWWVVCWQLLFKYKTGIMKKKGHQKVHARLCPHTLYHIITNTQCKIPCLHRPLGSKHNTTCAYDTQNFFNSQNWNDPTSLVINAFLILRPDHTNTKNTQDSSHDNMGDQCQVDYAEWWGDVSLFFYSSRLL